MPSLRAFNRQWNIASDDFVFPGISEACIRLSWFFFGVGVFVFHFPLQCSTQNLRIYFEGLILVNGITAILALVTAVLSARGTIINSRKRRHVTTMLYIRLPIFMFEILWNGVCTFVAFQSIGEAKGCHFVTITRVAVVLEWLLILTVFVIIIVVFHGNNDNMENADQFARRVWMRRFRIFKIRQDALMRAAIDDLANLFASFFYDTDLVMSDVAAGLLLVVHSPTNVYPPLVPAQSDDHCDWMTLKNAHHFFHFATCVYGWPTYLMHNLSPSHIYKLFKRMRCCGNLSCDRRACEIEVSSAPHRRLRRIRSVHPASLPPDPCTEQNAESTMLHKKYSLGQSQNMSKKKHDLASMQVLVIEDNCCFCNTSAFLLGAEDKNIDLFFVSFRNRLYEVPFVVLADHESKSIVITIRGSCSPVDLITDLCLNDEILSVDVDADPILRQDTSLDGNGEIRVHRGMLRSARYVYDTLRKHNVLDDMYVLNPTYDLVICGHSLGAGVASLLTLLIKQKYPAVRCYAYCPPGCVISENGQTEMEQHVMSIVVGDDVVSRISYHSMYQMREKVHHELANCTRAKYEILIKGVFQLFFTPPWQTTPLSGTVVDSSNLIEGGTAATSYGTSPLHTAIDFPNPLCQRVQLYTPGKILYVGQSSVEDNDLMVQQWIDAKCLREIKLSASAFTDHLPKNVARILSKLSETESDSVTSSLSASASSLFTSDVMEV